MLFVRLIDRRVFLLSVSAMLDNITLAWLSVVGGGSVSRIMRSAPKKETNICPTKSRDFIARLYITGKKVILVRVLPTNPFFFST
jgi:hypothetical protein